VAKRQSSIESGRKTRQRAILSPLNFCNIKAMRSIQAELKRQNRFVKETAKREMKRALVWVCVREIMPQESAKPRKKRVLCSPIEWM
jgi:hypothetical protein